MSSVLGFVVCEGAGVRSFGGNQRNSGRVIFSGSVGTKGHVCCISMGGGHGRRLFVTLARDGGVMSNSTRSPSVGFRGRGVFLCRRSLDGFVGKLRRTVGCVQTGRRRIISERRRRGADGSVGLSVSFWSGADVGPGVGLFFWGWRPASLSCPPRDDAFTPLFNVVN